MQRPGNLKTTGGQVISRGDFLASGGQADVYRASLCSTGEPGVIKAFKSQFRTPATRERCEFLVKSRFRDHCPVIASPSHVIADGDCFGHFTPFAEGGSLETLVREGGYTLQQGLQVALAVVRACQTLHDRQVAHGDIHANNVLVHRGEGDVLIPQLIDLDNFWAPGLPPPPMIGQSLYISPEQHQAMQAKTAASPNLYTDRYSLAVLLHEVLLLKHPAVGSDSDERMFARAMYEGTWSQDPAVGGKPRTPIGGYPAEVLGPELSRLFRRSMLKDGESRPTPTEWKVGLQYALDNLYACPSCTLPFVFDASHYRCVLCGRNFPTVQIHGPNGVTISVDSAAVMVGREQLGGEPTVSARHAMFRRRGPIVTVESYGRNGTYTFNGSGWVRLPDRVAVNVHCNDRLRFSSVEVCLEEVQ